MILSASRRTDIPAFFGEWMVNRLRAGVVAVRNPLNHTQVSVLEFGPASVDCIVFWTKNPAPFLPHLDEIDRLGYKYYFQFTITPYGTDLEPGFDKTSVIETFQALSAKIGRGKVIWRYDPVVITETYTAAFHCEKFAALAETLSSYTDKCVISFVDRYSFLGDSFRQHGIDELDEAVMHELAEAFSSASRKHSLQLASCCERIDLSRYGIMHNKCVDNELVARISSRELWYKKDSSQRSVCGCAASRDIGAYNTCAHGCVYCYARREQTAPTVCDADSPMLCDRIDSERDKVTRHWLQSADGELFAATAG
jgi:hypothetical protein